MKAGSSSVMFPAVTQKHIEHTQYALGEQMNEWISGIFCCICYFSLAPALPMNPLDSQKPDPINHPKGQVSQRQIHGRAQASCSVSLLWPASGQQTGRAFSWLRDAWDPMSTASRSSTCRQHQGNQTPCHPNFPFQAEGHHLLTAFTLPARAWGSVGWDIRVRVNRVFCSKGVRMGTSRPWLPAGVGALQQVLLIPGWGRAPGERGSKAAEQTFAGPGALQRGLKMQVTLHCPYEQSVLFYSTSSLED